MTDKAVTYEEVVEVVAKATAMYYAHNRMPVMSGNPLDRLHPSLKRDCYDGARAALSAIRESGFAIVPREPTPEMIAACAPAHAGEVTLHKVGTRLAIRAGEIKPECGE